MAVFAQNGRRDVFRREALPHLDSIYRTAVRRYSDPALAQDLVQETFTHYLFRGGSGILSVIIERHGANETLPRRGSALTLADLTLRSVNEGPVAVASMDAAGYSAHVIGNGFSRQRTVA